MCSSPAISTAPEALIAQSVLDAAGVFAHVTDVDTQTMFGYGVAFGGHRLLVRGEDVADAVAVLREARAAPTTEGGTLHKWASPILGTILTLWFFFPMPVWRHWWREPAAS